jgi:hypothetical protein
MTAPVHEIDFSAPPEPGTVLLWKGQRYEVEGCEDHRRSEGSLIVLIRWRTHCADCGRPAVFRSPLRSQWPNRRCTECAKPGRRVR